MRGYRGYIEISNVIQGLYRENIQEYGNYNLAFRVQHGFIPQEGVVA